MLPVFLLISCASNKKQISSSIENDPKATIKSPTQNPEQLNKSIDSKSASSVENTHQQEIPAPQKNYTNWSYKGMTGPDMWGDLDTNYSTCKSGNLQSPIDLTWTRPKAKRNIEFKYSETGYHIEDNGHTVQVTFTPGNSVVIDDKEYDLIHFSFRSKSEHSISGKHYPMEGQFFHKSKSGEIAILSVMFVEGKSNPYLESMLHHLPKEKNRQIASTTLFDPGHLIPMIRTHYHYIGSLTTPPCTEGVNWTVFNTPVEMSKTQIQNIQMMYSENYRPLQIRTHHRVSNY